MGPEREILIFRGTPPEPFSGGRPPFPKDEREGNMSVFVVGHVEIKNEEGFTDYAEKGLAIVPSFGGEFVMCGELTRVLSGAHDKSTFAILKFPDRNKATDITFLPYDEAF